MTPPTPQAPRVNRVLPLTHRYTLPIVRELPSPTSQASYSALTW
jgi:hypothetical protein